jgi:DNA polymerase-3 subunit gamma/tau
LQYSLQPRLHLELGLLRLIHAGRLLPIEKALAALGAPASAEAVPARASVVPPPSTAPYRQTAPPASPDPGEPCLRDRLLAYLEENQLTMLADAVEHSTLTELPSELSFSGPPEFSLAFRDAGMRMAVQRVAGKALKVSFTAGGGAVSPAPAPPAPDEETARRALQHPEVQRFQQLFPDAQIRNVRNLKEGH